MLAVIMAGGVGERFWPKSRRRHPKQLLDLTGRGSMIALTVDRLQGLCEPSEIYVITNVEQRGAIVSELDGRVPADNVIGEPQGQNTAPCIGLAALLLRRDHGDKAMVVLPADHLVEPTDEFQDHLRRAADYVEANGGLLTFGVTPTRPETGYGYIKTGDTVDSKDGRTILHAEAFLEKPDAETAATFLASGEHLWNSGMFAWRVDTILDEIATHLPELDAVLSRIESALGTRPLDDVLQLHYPDAPSISIDYGVMEKSSHVVVMRADFKWNDVGSWEFMRDINAADSDGNVTVGDHVLIDAKGNTVVSRDKLVAILGVDDLVVVDGGDTLLVCHRDRVQDVKQVVQALRDRSHDSLT